MGRDHVAKHVSICRRVCQYLNKGAVFQADIFLARGTDTWLGNLQSQLMAAMPKAPAGEMPGGAEIYAYVRVLVAAARQEMRNDFLFGRSMTFRTAWAIQVAVLAMLVTGAEVPPCR